ncbi:MAG: WG repeat-containing protein [Lentisphaerae bacterium]|nr:WG repeat-containing protein [Lentisphaerota bacterium]
MGFGKKKEPARALSSRAWGIACAGLALAGVLSHGAGTEPGHLFPIREGGLYGYIDHTGRKVIEPKYASAWEFKDGLAYVLEPGRYGQEGFVRADGEWAFKLPHRRRWQVVDAFSDGMAMIIERNKFGFIDTRGEIVIPTDLSYAHPFSEGFCLAMREKSTTTDPRQQGMTLSREQGLLDKNGTFVFEPDFGGNRQYEGCEQIFMDGQWCFVTKEDYVVYKVLETVSSGLREGLVRVWSRKDHVKGRFGFVDKAGKIVIPITFERAEDFFDGRAKVWRDGKWGFIDKRGKLVIDHRFERVFDFSEQRARFERDERFGFIDKTGRIAIEPRFEEAYDFTEGLAAVAVEGRWGFIEPGGRMAIQPRYDNVREFDHGLAFACEGTKVGYIDQRGTFVYTYDTVFKE